MKKYLLIILLLLSQVSFAQFKANQKTISGANFFDYRNQNSKNFSYLTNDPVKVQTRNNELVGFSLGLGLGKFVTEKKLKSWSVYYNYQSNSALSQNYDSLEVNRLSYNKSRVVEHTFSLRNHTTNFVGIQPKFGFLWSYAYSANLFLNQRENENNFSGNVVSTTRNPSIGIGVNFNAGLWYKINDNFFVQASYNLLSANLTYANSSSNSSTITGISNLNFAVNATNTASMRPESISFGFTYMMK